MDRSWATEEGGSPSRPGRVEGSTARRGTERPAAGRRRSSEVLGASVAARPAWSWRRARPTGVGSALAVLVAVLALGAGAPARAQTEIWSDPEVSGNIGNGLSGCDNDSTATDVQCSTSLSDDDFTYDGTDYAFTKISFSSTGRLDVEWDPDLPATVEDLTLRVTTNSTTTVDFLFADADHKSDGRRYWDGLGGLTWSEDQSMALIRSALDRDAIPPGWSLKPDAVGAGETFRLMFVSSTTRNATSTDIADYNTHVQEAAAAGHADIREFADEFAVIGSTATVNVRLNTLTRAEDTDAPIYWVSTSATRSAVADGYADFWDGTGMWGDVGAQTEMGAPTNLPSNNPANTGSLLDGTTSQFVLGGYVNFVQSWIVNSTGALQTSATTPTDEYRLLGLSPIFRVAGDSGPTVAFGSSAYTAEEGGASATVTVELSAPAATSTTIGLTRTHQGGATSTDYSASTTVTILPPETSTSFTVTALADDEDEDGESVLFGFTSPLPDGIALGSPATTTVTLLDPAGPELVSATLSGLEVADGAGNAIELDDDFAPDMFAYTATVANAIVRITVTPTAAEADATYEIQGVSGTELMDADLDAAGFQVDLVPGDNVVQVEVTGANGSTTYTVTVARGTTVDLGAIPADWSLKPDAVAAGGGFRLLFVSSTTRTGDSTDIALYNDHVQAAAAVGHADIRAFADDFTVVGSTLAVNARANTLTQAADTDAPIYWVDASAPRSAVADDYADFYDGTWDNPDGRTEAGAAISLVANPVATGSLTDGATAASALGGVNGFVAGWAVSDSGVTTQGLDSTAEHPLLGLSPVLRVAAEVPAELVYWTANLTIEEPNGEDAAEGFCSDCDDVFRDYGNVSQETFEIAGTTYRVQSLRYGSYLASESDRLTLEVTGEGTFALHKVPGLELRVGEKRYVLTDAADSAGSFPTSINYIWTLLAADERPWPEPPAAGAEAEVRLVDAAPGCRVEVVGRTTIRWSKVTVGPGRSGLATDPPDYYGFDDANSVGALSDGAFDLGSTTDVGIDRVTVGTDGSLVFDESPDLPAADYPALRLHVCGDAFDLADAPPIDSRHTWSNSGLDWSTERPVHVALSVAPPDATLSDLGLKDNDGAGITLTPAFASVTTSYRATVANGVDEITVVATPNDTAATVEIQDEDGTALVDADTGTDGFQVSLRWGDNTIKVEVTAADGTTIGLYTVSVSRALARPSVSPTEGSTTGLDVSWEAPGGTTVLSYDVQYREGNSGSFTDGPQSVNGTSTSRSIPGLKTNTSYQVQVRMTSAAGDSEWSPNGRGWTHTPEATVASDWSLLPGGLATGAKFRLLFVSHGERWNESQIDSYNVWVQEYAAAARGHTAIRAHASGFRAVGCGKWVNARENTGTQWSASDRGVPIHWLGGLIAADDYGDFYDGTWQNEDAPRTEAGALKSFNGYVLTGCTNAGDSSVGGALGQGFTARGRLDANSAGPLSGGGAEKGSKPIYGLSQVFVVGASSDVTANRVSFGSSSYTATEGGAPATVTVELSAPAATSTTIGLTRTDLGDATAADYSGAPSSVTIGRSATSTSFTVTAIDDALDDDGESILFEFTSPLPEDIVLGSTATTTIVSLADNDVPTAVSVSFGSSLVHRDGGRRAGHGDGGAERAGGGPRRRSG